MKQFAKLAIGFCAAGLLTFGADWNAKLLDASCAGANTAPKTSAEKLAKSCAPSAATTAFAIEDKGKIYELDASGNEKAAAAMKGGAFKADKDGDIHVDVKGTAQGNTIKVDSISGGKGD